VLFRSRDLSTGKNITNKFDDFITISFKDEKGEWQYLEWEATTDPGKKSMTMTIRRDIGIKGGCHRLVPGQYISTWSIDLHQGKYEALCQLHGKVRVYIDPDLDMVYDEEKVTKGMYSINIHCVEEDPAFTEDWSDGCQIFKRKQDFNEFMGILKKSAEIHGNKFSYTLLEL